jgi:hypothetical protein
VTQEVECKALSSNPSTEKKIRRYNFQTKREVERKGVKNKIKKKEGRVE